MAEHWWMGKHQAIGLQSVSVILDWIDNWCSSNSWNLAICPGGIDGCAMWTHNEQGQTVLDAMSSKIVKLNGHKLKADKMVRKLDSILRSIERLEKIQRRWPTYLQQLGCWKITRKESWTNWLSLQSMILDTWPIERIQISGRSRRNWEMWTKNLNTWKHYESSIHFKARS